VRLLSFHDGKTRRLGLRRADGVLDLTSSPLGVGTLEEALDQWGDFSSQVGEVVGSGAADFVGDIRPTLPFTPRRVLATGANYRSHVDEMGAAPPAEPSAFLKLPGAVCGPADPIELPGDCEAVDYEGEIAVVVGRPASAVDPEEAESVIAGLMLANDVSARDLPLSHTVLAKGSPSFCPLGPELVTTDELDIDDLEFTVLVNGEARQQGATTDMVHSIREIVACYSAASQLQPRDVILTGTPGGVGLSLAPPCFLRSGDEVAIRSPQLGTLRNPVVDATSPARQAA